jgi:serine/threonine-protein kinase
MRTSKSLWLFTLALLAYEPAALAAGRVVSASSGQRYEMGRLVGKGGFGRVYKAWPLLAGDKRGQPVIIKHYASLATAIDESEALRHVDGLPRLPQALGAGFDDKVQKDFLVSRYVTGRTLEKWAAAKQRTPAAIVEAVANAASVVGDLNARGWLHLDITPKNIMVNRRREAEVIDIGIAQPKGASGTVRATGAGTRSFMPPEQRTKAQVDDRTDVFALTGTLYRLLAGKNPIRNQKRPSSIVGAATGLQKIDDPALRAIVARGLAPDPNDRYPNAAALAEALRAWHSRSASTSF